MEIREGIKFKHKDHALEYTINKIIDNDANIIWKDYSNGVSYTIETSKELFKEGSWILTYYPYQTKDWIKVIADKPGFYFNQGDVFQVGKVYNNSGYLENNESSTILMERCRPAFEDEIPKSIVERMIPLQEEYNKTRLAIQQQLVKVELLAKARRDYPIGTKFKSVFDGEINIVKSDCKFTGEKNEISVDTDIWKTGNMVGTPIYTKDGKWAEIIVEDLEVFVAPKESKIILPNKTENMNDLEKELKEREYQLMNQKCINEANKTEFDMLFGKLDYPISECRIVGTSTNNKIKPNLIKHNNSRFQKLLIIRTNKNKSKGI